MIETLPLRRVARVANGGTPTSDEANWGGEIPWATPVDLGLHHGGAVEETARTLTEHGARTGSSTVPAGSVLVSTRAPIGYVARTNVTMAFNQGCRGLIPGDRIDARFLAFALLAAHQELDARGQGSTFSELSADGLASVPVPVPPLEEQRRIADFLDTETARIDQLVAARKQQQPLLEERWRAEIRNELEGRGEGRTPSHVPWLARHPASWRPIRLRHLAHIQRGASPRPIDDPIYFDDAGTHAWVRISDVSASGKFLRRTDQTLSSLGRSRSVALKPGELFVSIAASVGKPVIAAIDCCIHDGFVAIRQPQASVDFLYYVLELGDCFNGLGKLGTQLNLNSDTIGSIVVALPPEREQAAIAHRLDRARESVDSIAGIIERQVGVLQERRQALITAAVTGRLDVTTARGGRS